MNYIYDEDFCRDYNICVNVEHKCIVYTTHRVQLGRHIRAWCVRTCVWMLVANVCVDAITVSPIYARLWHIKRIEYMCERLQSLSSCEVCEEWSPYTQCAVYKYHNIHSFIHTRNKNNIHMAELGGSCCCSVPNAFVPCCFMLPSSASPLPPPPLLTSNRSV